MTDGLKPKQREAIIAKLSANRKVERIVLFGSRAMGTFTPTSDIDIALFGRDLTLSDQTALSEAMTELSIPQRVDILIHHRIENQALREHIRKCGIEWFVRKHTILRTSAMGGEWKETPYGWFAGDFVVDRLADLCDLEAGIQTGPFGSQLHQEDYVSIGTPIITVEHLGENRILHEDVPKVSDADRDRLSRYLLRRGDIVFSRVGSVDRRALVREIEVGWLFSGRCLRVRPNPAKVDSHYLSYFFGLSAFKEHIRAIAVGATMPSLNTSLLSDVVVPHPSDIPEQRAIAHILGTLDDKIELNRRMSETLEAMARALFKAWFVDFEPVRAKAAVRREHPDWSNEQVSRAACPKMKLEIAALFPDSFEDSELGEIPRGWRTSPIGDVVQVLGGGTPSTKEPAYWEGGIHPFCTPKDMALLTDSVLLQTERHLTNEGLAKVSSGQLPVGTVLLSSRAPIGYLAVAETPVSINQGIIAMVCDGELPNLYVLHWTKANMDRVLANANGSTFMEISKRNFRPITAVIPPQPVLRCFMQIVGPMHLRVVASIKQIQILAAIRDTFLPKLISGELRVPDGERMVGRAV